MTTETLAAKKRIIEDKQQYLDYVANFKQKARNKNISSADIMLYHLVRGKDWRLGFTPLKNANRLANSPPVTAQYASVKKEGHLSAAYAHQALSFYVEHLTKKTYFSPQAFKWVEAQKLTPQQFVDAVQSSTIIEQKEVPPVINLQSPEPTPVKKSGVLSRLFGG